jgi:hypothetical protein
MLKKAGKTKRSMLKIQDIEKIKKKSTTNEKLGKKNQRTVNNEEQHVWLMY